MNKRWVLFYYSYMFHVDYSLLVNKITTVVFHDNPLCHLIILLITIYILDDCPVSDGFNYIQNKIKYVANIILLKNDA